MWKQELCLEPLDTAVMHAQEGAQGMQKAYGVAPVGVAPSTSPFPASPFIALR